MKLLAWDTSSKTAALSAMEWETGRDDLRLVSEWTLNVDTQHSERLLWGVHEMLEAARWKLADIDYFGVGVGPGSFTGLRIGLTTARTLAHSCKKPLVGVSSLAALARPVALWLSSTRPGSQRNSGKPLVVATTDAAKGELFALWGAARSVSDCVSMAQGDEPGLWKRGVEEKVLPPEELTKALKKKLREGGRTGWLAVGEGRHRHADAWKSLPASQEIVCPAPFGNQIQGRYLGILAWEGIQGGLAREALRVHPRYIRASDAEVKLRAGLLKRAPETA